MLVKNIQNTDIVSINGNATIKEAIKEMKLKNVGFLIINDLSNEILGIITDRDIMIGLLYYNLNDSILRITKTNLIFIKDTEDLEVCADTCAYYQVTRLLVRNDNNDITGIISIYDILAIDSVRLYAADCLTEIKKNDIIYKYELECDVNIADKLA